MALILNINLPVDGIVKGVHSAIFGVVSSKIFRVARRHWSYEGYYEDLLYTKIAKAPTPRVLNTGGLKYILK